MNRFGSSTYVWGLVVVAVIAVAVFRLRTVDEGSSSGGPTVEVTSSQRAAIEAIDAQAPVYVKTDGDGQVITIVATGPEVTDAVLSHIGSLTTLKTLELQTSAISDAGLEVIGTLPELESLTLSQTSISAEGLKTLTGLSTLQLLALEECNIGDEAADSLAQIESLQTLNLSQTTMTDDGLAKLSPLKNLESLYLSGTQITGEGFAAFDSHQNLKLLMLTETPLTPSGIQNLRQFPNLERLYLNRVQIDHETLVQLMDMLTTSHPQLAGLFFEGASLTDESIEPLKAIAELPNLALVNLDQTEISKQAFRKLAAEVPDVQYLVDYPLGND